MDEIIKKKEIQTKSNKTIRDNYKIGKKNK
jgi:hypothetical protein